MKRTKIQVNQPKESRLSILPEIYDSFHNLTRYFKIFMIFFLFMIFWKTRRIFSFSKFIISTLFFYLYLLLLCLHLHSTLDTSMHHSSEPTIYHSHSTGHKGDFGREIMKFEFHEDGLFLYSNESEYRTERPIRKCGMKLLFFHIYISSTCEFFCHWRIEEDHRGQSHLWRERWVVASAR